MSTTQETGNPHPLPCVVVGLRQNGLGVVRALGRRGVPVIAIDGPQWTAYAATRYARRVVCNDPSGTALIDTLESVGRELGRAVLILTLDQSVLLVSRHRHRLEPWFTHSLPDDSVVLRLMSKGDTECFARAHGFGVPRTCVIRNEEDLEASLSIIGLPCILKPQIKTVAFVRHSPKKAFFIRTASELRRTWQQIVQWEPEVVVQEWIEGPDTNLVFSLYYFNRDGQPLATFSGRKIRQFIPRCGTASSAEPWEDVTAREAGIKFFQAADYQGFGAIEFKIDPAGRYYLIEPTVGRTEHIFALAEENGLNLPYIGYCDMAGRPIPPAKLRRKRIYVDFKRDVRAARELVREGELTWAGWARSVARPSQRALFAWDDLGPITSTVWTRAHNRVVRLSAKAAARTRNRLSAWRHKIDEADIGAPLVPTSPRPTHEHLEATLAWLCAAHDAGQGGVSRAYSLRTTHRYPKGWQAAYPETTGYIIPTFFDCATRLGRPDLAERAVQIADWEVGIQLEDGGFQGGVIGLGSPPVVFNTGMVMLGLVRALAETNRASYRDALARAARFLLNVQSRDGAWRRFVSVTGDSRVHAYDCLVDWALAAASELMGEPTWGAAARRHLDFTLTLQERNGWFWSNSLRPARDNTPLTHTIGYAIAGFLEAGTVLKEDRYLEAAARAAAGVAARVQADGFLSGELDRDWKPAVSWCCLTGSAQMAIIWYRLHDIGRTSLHLPAASRVLDYLKARHETRTGGPETRGGLAGSFPAGESYAPFQFPNWAAKFFADLLVLSASAEREGVRVPAASATL